MGLDVSFASSSPLCIDKPLGWSSFDVVKRIRGLLSAKKVGHAGTLDPLATGLLLLCVDADCKHVARYQAMEKTYEGLLRFGDCRPSYDLETPSIAYEEAPLEVGYEQLRVLSERFQGSLMQTPPLYSAIQVGGRRAYRYARRSESVVLLPRSVEVHSFDFLRLDWPWLRFRLSCGKGTYVRSLVHDFGQAVGCGAALHALHRSRIGPYDVAQALTPSAFADAQGAAVSMKDT